MTWNYRVLDTGEKNQAGEPLYCIHEVYYHKSGYVEGWCEEPETGEGMTVEELETYIAGLWEALDQPFLVEQKLNQESEDRKQREEAQYQELYGGKSQEELCAILDAEIKNLCPVVENGRHCRYKVGHTHEHSYADPEKMLRLQLWIEYFPLTRRLER